MITYLFTVCDETERFIESYNQISSSLLEGDKIFIQYDSTNGDSTLLDYLVDNNIEHVEYAFNGNFSDIKNNAISYVTTKWIVQLEGDEYLNDSFLENIHSFLDTNSIYDAFYVDRCDFNIDSNEDGDVNKFIRIFKKLPWIKWKGNIHESLDGIDMFMYYPYSIIHRRTDEETNNQYQ
jgi:hypothetical protein